MTKAELTVKHLSEMYDIYMDFRHARTRMGIPTGTRIEGMTLEEFEELRRKCLEEMESSNGRIHNGDAPPH